jgi:hypothetical protein
LPVALLTFQPVSEVDAAAGRGKLDAATDGEEVKTRTVPRWCEREAEG